MGEKKDEKMKEGQLVVERCFLSLKPLKKGDLSSVESQLEGLAARKNKNVLKGGAAKGEKGSS